jgi:uncharacterized membrane protein YebE (DUF533 family)
MFDARKLLDAFIGAAAQLRQSSGQQSGQPQSASGQTSVPPGQTQAGPTIAGQVDETLRQVTGQGTDQLVQKAKDVMAQNPALAPAVMVGLAGLFSARRRSGGVPGGGLAKLGGLALIGTLAYKAYQNRQAGKPLLDMGGVAGALGGALNGLGQGQAAGGGAQPQGQGQGQGQERQLGQEKKQGQEPEPEKGIAGQGSVAAGGQNATAGAAQSQGEIAPTLNIPQDSKFHPVSQTEDDALLYLRAMVAAASSDGQIDEAERARILKGVSEAGIDAEATRWLEREFASPADVEELSANVNTPEKAAQVYAAARIAIDPDTMQEREFLRQLAEALDLDQATRAQIDDTAAAGA